MKSVIDVIFALGLWTQVLVLPFVIPLLGIGLQHLYRAMRTGSDSERKRSFSIVALTWGLIIMALIASGLPVW